jgi:hypothetical protein
MKNELKSLFYVAQILKIKKPNMIVILGFEISNLRLVSAGEFRRPCGFASSSAVLFRWLFVVANSLNVANNAFFFAHFLKPLNHLFN